MMNISFNLPKNMWMIYIHGKELRSILLMRIKFFHRSPTHLAKNSKLVTMNYTLVSLLKKNLNQEAHRTVPLQKSPQEVEEIRKQSQKIQEIWNQSEHN